MSLRCSKRLSLKFDSLDGVTLRMMVNNDISTRHIFNDELNKYGNRIAKLIHPSEIVSTGDYKISYMLVNESIQIIHFVSGKLSRHMLKRQ